MNNRPATLPSSSVQEPERVERRERRQERRQQRRRSRIILGSTIGTSVVLLAVIGLLYLQIQTAIARPYFPDINAVPCQSAEQNGYHIHAHLSIYINGKRAVIPPYIGIETSPDYTCFYWLHTHSADGIIHIEAPQKQHNLALDDFLTIWYNGFANLEFPQELLATTGWKTYINGKLFTGTQASPINTEIPLNSHDIVTLEYGTGNPSPDIPASYHFPANLPR